MARGDGLRVGSGPNPGRSGGIPPPVSWNRVNSGGIPESGSRAFQNPLPSGPSFFGSYPRIPRPDRYEAGGAERTGATPPLARCPGHGCGPRWCPRPFPGGGIAPVLFIPAGRLGAEAGGGKRRGPSSALRAAASTSGGREPRRTRSLGETLRLPKRRTVMATLGLAGGTQMATLDPSSRRASTIGFCAGSRPRGRAIWMAARASARRSSAGAGWGWSFPCGASLSRSRIRRAFRGGAYGRRVRPGYAEHEMLGAFPSLWPQSALSRAIRTHGLEGRPPS